MPLRYLNRIPDLLSRIKDDAMTLRELADRLLADQSAMDVLVQALDQLVADERVERGEDGRYRLPSIGDTIEGIIRITRGGFGFVVPDSPVRGGDVYVAIGATGGAISGDRVLVSVSSRRGQRGRGPAGRVERIVHRSRTAFAGTVFKRGRTWLINPDGRDLQGPIVIRDPFVKPVKQGEKVVFELVADPDGNMLGEGAITRVLGEAGRPDVETAAVIAAFGLRTSFSQDVIDEARQAATELDSWREAVPSDREDLTGQVVFTIDPPDARDFDDAISIEFDKKLKQWTLGIHIADVSHFVPTGGPMDLEARDRGNSVYLPRLVLAMLPEVLSNGVCSLQEGVHRFCKSAFVSFDERGRVVGQRFASTVIRSRKRLTYLEAQALLDGDPATARRHMRSETTCQPEVVEALQLADTLARTLRRRRRRDGMIVLDLPDAELFFDDDGHVVDVQPEDDAFTHTIIEMFMVEANEAVARHFEGLELPLLRRIHPEPELEDTEDLRLLALGLGFRLPESITRHDLQKLLEKTAGTASARAVHFAVLRTLTKAEYSPAPVGHFALASAAYAHFTSPIRRYPDLLVHRALQAWLDATDNGTVRVGGRRRAEVIGRLRDDQRLLDEASLVEQGRHCSETEVNAERAERELRTFLVLQHIESEVLGDDVPGVITGFNSQGVWVMLDRYLVDGQIPWDGMGSPGTRPDRWEEIKGTGRIVSARNGSVLCVGDPITVQVVRVDSAERDMELMLKKHPNRTARELPQPSPGPRTRRESSRKRKRRR